MPGRKLACCRSPAAGRGSPSAVSCSRTRCLSSFSKCANNLGAMDARHREVLIAVIREYVDSAEPVGSRVLTKRYFPSLSPATIRNVMSDLEEMGYLAQPHTSAGRIPTDKAYRFYVESFPPAGSSAA